MVGNEAVVNMYDLAVKEVVGISAVVNSMAVSGVVDTIAVSVVMVPSWSMGQGLMRRWMIPLWSVGWWLMRR